MPLGPPNGCRHDPAAPIAHLPARTAHRRRPGATRPERVAADHDPTVHPQPGGADLARSIWDPVRIHKHWNCIIILLVGPLTPSTAEGQLQRCLVAASVTTAALETVMTAGCGRCAMRRWHVRRKAASAGPA